MKSGIPGCKVNKLFLLVTVFVLGMGIPRLVAQINDEPMFGSQKNYDKVLVIKVRSADTFVIDGSETIKLIGLDAPSFKPKYQRTERDSYGIEIHKPVDPTTTPEEKSYDFARELLLDKYVRLEFDAQRKDENLVTLAYVYLSDGTFLNEEILKQGFASLHLSPPNTKYDEILRAAYQEARKEKRGIHINE